MRSRDIRALRQAKDQRRLPTEPASNNYADAVMRAFDDLAHADQRQQQEQRSEVERKARNAL